MEHEDGRQGHSSPETPGDREERQDKPELSLWTQAGMVGALGFEIVAFTVVGVWLGSWVDETYGTAPYGALIGLLLGMAAVGLHIWHVVGRLLDSSSSKERADDERGD